jgi:hypothetical protein
MRRNNERKEAIMRLLLGALAALMLAGCAVVPVPAPVPYGYAAPGVSVGIGVGPVYGGGYRHYPYRGYYRGYPYGHHYWR